MRSLILADRSIARRERAMLSRLEVGLADEGVRVVHAVPRLAMEEGTVGLYSTAVGYDDGGLAIGRRGRARRLLRAIHAVEQEGVDPDFDVVHAFGVGCWPFAMELARQTGAGVLLELWRSSAIAQAAGMTGKSLSAVPVRYVVSESSVGSALRKRAATASVVSAPWGVHAPATHRSVFDAQRPLAVAVLADAGDAKATGAALSGLLEATKALGVEVLLFLGTEDGIPAREAAIWSVARKLGVLDRLSMVPEMEARREPVVQMDMLVLPEASGRQRTLALEAMANGMLVVALADPFVESLTQGVTARLVPTAAPHDWAGAFAALLNDRGAAEAQVRAAHAWVREHRSASSQVAGVIKAYEQLIPLRPTAEAAAR